MKKKKYRIKEYVRRDGSRYFRVQERFFLVWISTIGTYDTQEEAQKTIESLRAFEILESITHKVD